jgi:hypothetical protein
MPRAKIPDNNGTSGWVGDNGRLRRLMSCCAPVWSLGRDEPIPTQHSQAPPRFAKRLRLQFPHSLGAPHRRLCNASRSGFCANNAFGSQLARSMPLSPRRKERPRHRSKKLRRSCCGDQSFSVPTSHRSKGRRYSKSEVGKARPLKVIRTIQALDPSVRPGFCTRIFFCFTTRRLAPSVRSCSSSS